MKKLFLSMVFIVSNASLSAVMIEKAGILVQYEESSYPSFPNVTSYAIEVSNHSMHTIVFDSSFLASTPILTQKELQGMISDSLYPRVGLGRIISFLFGYLVAYQIDNLLPCTLLFRDLRIATALLTGWWVVKGTRFIIPKLSVLNACMQADRFEGKIELNPGQSAKRIFWAAGSLDAIKIDFDAIKIRIPINLPIVQ